MMDEQGGRFAVLLEDVDRKLGAVAEAVAVQAADLRALKNSFEGLDARFDEMTVEMRELKNTVSHVSTKVDKLEGKVDKLDGKVDKLEGKVDKLEGKVDKLEGKVDKLEGKVDKLDGKVDKLEAFAADAAPRLVRIEAHLALPGPLPRRDTTRPAPSKHHRRKPAKQT